MNNLEQTLSIIKPDAVERNLETEIKEMFISNGFTVLKEKKNSNREVRGRKILQSAWNKAIL